MRRTREDGQVLSEVVDPRLAQACALIDEILGHELALRAQASNRKGRHHMFPRNEGAADRIARAVAGSGLIAISVTACAWPRKGGSVSARPCWAHAALHGRQRLLPALPPVRHRHANLAQREGLSMIGQRRRLSSEPPVSCGDSCPAGAPADKSSVPRASTRSCAPSAELDAALPRLLSGTLTRSACAEGRPRSRLP